MPYFLEHDALSLKNKPSLKQQLAAARPLRQPPALELDQLNEQGRELAARHRLAPRRNINVLSAGLAENERVLLQVYELLNELTDQAAPAWQARELIQTSFNIIRDQVHKAKSLLIQVDSALPWVKPENDTVPRIYDIAGWMITHTHARLEPAHLVSLLLVYQEVTGLQITELKAFRAMLKVTLIDHLRSVSVRLAIGRIDRQLHAGRPANERLYAAEESYTADKVLQRNCISSLRILDTIDWEEFIDQVSIVEPVLRREQSGVYPAMDFYTRDHYRMEIGRIAVRTKLTEVDVARWVVVAAAHAQAGKSSSPQGAHIGFFLIGEGRRQLERSLGINKRQALNWRQQLHRRPLPYYLGGMAIITVLLLMACMPALYNAAISPGWRLCIALLLLPAAGHVAKLIVDAVMSAVTKPVLLPRFDFSTGIPEAHRTLVAIPSMLSDTAAIERLVHALEVRYWGNRDPHLYFALVTDHLDAHQETLPQDALLLEKAQSCINRLNEKYCEDGAQRFFLFHRPRKWNAREKLWMGYERKRGKLLELNKLLRGQGASCFSHITGNIEQLGHIRYVIALDSDTQLPRDTAWKMVATMAHPLNKAVYSKEKSRVVSGYGMLQPRIGSDLRGSADSRYQRLHCAMPEIDPYIYAAPDLYQDLFHEGSFVGKGIYDVDIMINAVDQRFPENRILSHDMLEGCYARAGLLNDLTLFERPVGFWNDLNRRHRWIRGDWQIAAWAGPLVPAAAGGLTRNPLAGLSRWKVFDNLRSSLLPVCLLLLLILGCTVLQQPLRWALFMLLVVYAPGLVALAGKIIEKPGKILSWKHWQYSFNETLSWMQLSTYKLFCLPIEAWSATDAIIRTAWRLLVSRRKLLEWMPSDTFKEQHGRTIRGTYRVLWMLPFAAVMLSVCLYFYDGYVLAVAAPLLLIWAASPAVIWWMNRALTVETTMVSAAQEVFLRRLARKTWSYFDELVVAAHNWLPPDHVQEYPLTREAEYTSPTNMGLALLANLTANDFGYITTGSLLERTGRTLQTMARLERYNGHFYNWYDTRSLRPATPRYVSTVDSGNLAGHLLTLRQGILALPARPVIDAATICKGLTDTLLLLEQTLKAAGFTLPSPEPDMLPAYLDELQTFLANTAAYCSNKPDHEFVHWWHALDRQCKDALTELQLLMPWLFLAAPPQNCSRLVPAVIPALQQVADAATLLQNCHEQLEVCNNTIEQEWLHDFEHAVMNAQKAARERLEIVNKLAALCDELGDMEYDFLYNRAEQLLSIGYQVETGCQDTDCYDVLASEARLATFVGISQNKLPVRSWFTLGRPLVKVNEDYTLLSANGTMFEYLMPLLVMPSFKDSLLDHACRSAVRQQMHYAQALGLPWGISESCYGMMDANQHYQYKVFGIQELGLKRDNKGNDRVVAPYASAMALMVAPELACHNLERLSAEGFEGRYGFYEAIDYTPAVLSGDQSHAIVHSFMAHHQGMSLLAYSHLLLAQPMQQRFLADPKLESSLLLLQESVPRDTTFYLYEEEARATAPAHSNHPAAAQLTAGFREEQPLAPAVPEVQLLSNGRYHLTLTSNGDGCSRWEDSLIGTWNEEGITTGIACYIRDLAEAESIPVAWQHADSISFLPGCADCHFTGQDMQIHTRIIIAAEEDIEIRQLTICNLLDDLRVIEVFSMAQSWLPPVWQNRDAVAGCETETIKAQQAVLSCRKAAAPNEREPWMFHTIKAYNANMRVTSFASEQEDATAIRCRIALRPGEKIILAICRGIGESREACTALLEKSRTPFLADHLLQQAWLHEMALLKQVNATMEEIQLSRQIAAAVIFSANNGQQEYTIPAKKPALILRIASAAHIEAVAGIIQVHAYWRLKGFPVTLEIWNEDQGCYRHFLQRLIMELITSGMGAEALNRHEGGIFVKSTEQLTEEGAAGPDSNAFIIAAASWHKWESPLRTTATPEELLTI